MRAPAPAAQPPSRPFVDRTDRSCRGRHRSAAKIPWARAPVACSAAWSSADPPSIAAVRPRWQRCSRRASERPPSQSKAGDSSRASFLGLVCARLALRLDLGFIEVAKRLGRGIQSQRAILAGGESQIVQRNNARQISNITGKSTEIVIAAPDLDRDRQLSVVILA